MKTLRMQQLKCGDNKDEDNCPHVNSVSNDNLIPEIQTLLILNDGKYSRFHQI